MTMHAKEYIVSSFALFILIFFCLPIFALSLGIALGLSPNTLWLKISVGLTDAKVVNSLHSLLLPLTGAVIVFRADYFAGIFGVLILLVLCLGIVCGFFVVVAITPTILGSLPRFDPYASDFKGVGEAVSNMISMMILLFLAKLGVDAPPPADATSLVRRGATPSTTGAAPIEPGTAIPAVAGGGK
ncbi:MAG: hypothetical protein M3Y78_07800 [Pseudomonadota bacterium]|nr:hypothetical protein [Pseudomonadota bacterium]